MLKEIKLSTIDNLTPRDLTAWDEDLSTYEREALLANLSFDQPPPSLAKQALGPVIVVLSGFTAATFSFLNTLGLEGEQEIRILTERGAGISAALATTAWGILCGLKVHRELASPSDAIDFTDAPWRMPLRLD